MKKEICKFCDYEWTPRIDKPKRCPACSRWVRKHEHKKPVKPARH